MPSLDSLLSGAGFKHAAARIILQIVAGAPAELHEDAVMEAITARLQGRSPDVAVRQFIERERDNATTRIWHGPDRGARRAVLRMADLPDDKVYEKLGIDAFNDDVPLRHTQRVNPKDPRSKRSPPTGGFNRSHMLQPDTIASIVEEVAIVHGGRVAARIRDELLGTSACQDTPDDERRQRQKLRKAKRNGRTARVA